jgi:hypothetical protein
MSKPITLFYSDKYIESRSSGEALQRSLFYAAKARAKQRDIDFTITKDDIEVVEYCPILDIKLERKLSGSKGPQDCSPTLDRIDPAKGYTPNNIRVISYKANRYKNNMDRKIIQKLLDYIDGKL